MVVELFYRQDFSEGVGQVLLSVDLLKVDVTSFHDLSYEVVAAQDMLGSVMRLWLFRLGNRSSAVTVHWDGTLQGRYHSQLAQELP